VRAVPLTFGIVYLYVATRASFQPPASGQEPASTHPR
jgi:hypothetical protein